MLEVKKTYMVIGILLLLFLVIFWRFGVSRSGIIKTKDEKNTSLQFEQDTLRLGLLRLGQSTEVTFKYTNTGELPLIIKNVQASCGCIEARWSKEPLGSRKSGILKITFKAESEGHFLKSIFVVSNIWQKVYQLHINGEVIK